MAWEGWQFLAGSKVLKRNKAYFYLKVVSNFRVKHHVHPQHQEIIFHSMMISKDDKDIDQLEHVHSW